MAAISTIAYHHIPTTGNPVRVNPGLYKKEVEQQIHDMLQQGIIEESCSPWMAPAVLLERNQVTSACVWITES